MFPPELKKENIVVRFIHNSCTIEQNGLLHFSTEKNLLFAHIGDYIVKDTTGNISSFPEQVFWNHYEMVNED